MTDDRIVSADEARELLRRDEGKHAHSRDGDECEACEAEADRKAAIAFHGDALARTVVALHAKVERLRARLAAAEECEQQSADDAATVAVERDAAEVQLAEARAELARVTAERDALRAAVREFFAQVDRFVRGDGSVGRIRRAEEPLRALIEAPAGESGGERG